MGTFRIWQKEEMPPCNVYPLQRFCNGNNEHYQVWFTSAPCIY